MKIVANELVIPFKEGFQCHASHFIRLSNGNIFCVYFYGSREGADDVRIYGSMRTPDCRWSEPAPITEDDGVPHWNPVLFARKDGAVVLFYKVGKNVADWVTRCKISYDGCITWSDSFEAVAGDTSGGRGPVRNKAVYLSDGSVLAPASTERGEWKCFFDRSFDDGKTWNRGCDLRLSDTLLKKYPSLERRGIIQPTVWESGEGIHALFRSSEDLIFRSDSPDGTNWSEPYSIDMPNNNSGIDAAVLPDGRVILACNPVEKNWGERSPLSLFVSEDNGRTFGLLTHLVTMKGEFSYPAIRYEDGLLHVTYTWNRRSISYMCFDLINQ